jgi:glycosyltransferase involved in cell wall biosynthesis
MTEPRVLPLISVVTPAFNEEALISANLATLCAHLDTLSGRYRWELIVVNDGSRDRTGPLADAFAATRENVRVVHHPVNLNLGQGIRTGFAHARGEYIVVLDMDLSYAPDHVERLVDTLEATKADIAVASPYMPGGRCTAVPTMRLFLSKRANRFLAFFCHHVDLHTITGMVRAYRRDFVTRLSLKSNDIEINTEIVYKAMLLRGRIVEIPAHLDWSGIVDRIASRPSSFKIAKGILTYALSGFYFRPFVFFFLPGLLGLLLSTYLAGWLVYHIATAYAAVPAGAFIDDQLSNAIGKVFHDRPHAFFTFGIALLTSVQFLMFGGLSFQQKRYFEDLFFVSSERRADRFRDAD